MSFNEEQFEGKLADAMRSLGTEAPAAACFVMTTDGNGKVCLRVLSEDPATHKAFILDIVSCCIDMLTDIETTGKIQSGWMRVDDQEEEENSN